VPPAWRAACVAAAGRAASCARPALAGAAEGSAVRGDASAWGHVQRGFIFPILLQALFLFVRIERALSQAALTSYVLKITPSRRPLRGLVQLPFK